MPPSRPPHDDPSQQCGPRTVMSFARALQPTPSQVTLTSSMYSRTGESMLEGDAPSVPPIPQAYARPYAVDEADDYQGQDSVPTPTERSRQAFSPLSQDVNRQKEYDIALARMEGTYISPNNTPSHSAEAEYVVEPSQRRETAEVRDQRKYETWPRQQAKQGEQNEQERQNIRSDPVQQPAQVRGPPSGNAASEYLPASERGQRWEHDYDQRLARSLHLERNELQHEVRPIQESRPHTTRAAEPSRPHNRTNTTRSHSTKEAAINPHNSHPSTASPSCFTNPEQKLKSLAKKALKKMPGPWPRPMYWLDAMDRCAVDLEFYKNSGWGAWYDSYQRGQEQNRRFQEAMMERLAEEQARQEQIAWWKERAKEEGRRHAPQADRDAGKKRRAGEAMRKHCAEMDRARREGEGETARRARQAAEVADVERPDRGDPVKGVDTQNDGRKPVVIELDDAQRKYVGHPGRNPLFVCAAYNHPEAANQAFAPAPREPSLRRPSFVPLSDGGQDEPEHHPSAKYAARYQQELPSPDLSPADFSEIQHGTFPTDQRVLYDPKLSSHVEMPRFHEEYFLPKKCSVGDPKEFAEHIAKMRREEKLRVSRVGNATRQGLLAQQRAGSERRRERRRRE